MRCALFVVKRNMNTNGSHSLEYSRIHKYTGMTTRCLLTARTELFRCHQTDVSEIFHEAEENLMFVEKNSK